MEGHLSCQFGFRHALLAPSANRSPGDARESVMRGPKSVPAGDEVAKMRHKRSEIMLITQSKIVSSGLEISTSLG